jgi:hypothetical protein
MGEQEWLRRKPKKIEIFILFGGAHLGGIHEERVGIGGARHDMVKGEHAQLEQGVVAACCHVGQRQARDQLSHCLPMRTLIHHLQAPSKECSNHTVQDVEAPRIC